MTYRWMLALGLLFSLALLAGCTPSGDSVKSAIQGKTFCALDDWKVDGAPKEDKQGYLHYSFSTTINCKGSRSFYSAKFPEATRVTGEAEMLGKWFGLVHDLTKYSFEAEESGTKEEKSSKVKKPAGDKGDDE